LGHGENAAVVVTEGPVPVVPRLSCGERFVFRYRRSGGKWTLDEGEDEGWTTCANPGVPLLSSREAALRDVLRLSFDDSVEQSRIVAGKQLSAEARAVLARLTPLLEEGDVATEQFSLPPRHIVVTELTLDGDVAILRTKLGPVSKRGSGSQCGSSGLQRLRRMPRGWKFEEISGSRC
jgi:hypothetical protein